MDALKFLSLAALVFGLAAEATEAPTNLTTSYDPSSYIPIDVVVGNLSLPIGPDGRMRWYAGPNVRGTWEIIWTCLATIVICTWTLLCLNLPAPQENTLTSLFRRLRWMTLAGFAPEIVLAYAAGQWSRARQSVADFRSIGYGPDRWNKRMAFFADMGGFVLLSPDEKPFPLNAKQLHWLVKRGYLDFPTVGQKEIDDKSKQDWLAKAIALAQVTYLMVEAAAQSLKHLAITLLELNTVVIVVCALLTAGVWWSKPSGVRVQIPLVTTHRIADIIGRNTEWTNTPLDFIDENGPGWTMTIQPFLGLPVLPRERPILRIPDDRFPIGMAASAKAFVILSALLLTGLYVTGWSFSFPTYIEGIFWRAASLTVFGMTLIFWAFVLIVEQVRPEGARQSPSLMTIDETSSGRLPGFSDGSRVQMISTWSSYRSTAKRNLWKSKQ